ncbi:MAG TPA: hypothetical protein VF230_17165 [Acidimicrobiales bacterium]
MDDAFERAARREAVLAEGSAAQRDAVLPLVGLQLAWAVLLGLHWWLAGGEGRWLAVHATVFTAGLALTLMATIAMRAGPRWSMFAIVAGWAPLLALHWIRASERTTAVTVNTVAFAVALAIAVLAVFSTPRTDSAS